MDLTPQERGFLLWALGFVQGTLEMDKDEGRAKQASDLIEKLSVSKASSPTPAP